MRAFYEFHKKVSRNLFLTAVFKYKFIFAKI
jgi:hypothetical protein